MKEITVWIRNITGYVLFLAVLDQILPGKEHGKYVRLFSGMVLLLLLIQPVLNPNGAVNRAAQSYREQQLRYDTGHLKAQLLEVDKQKYAKMLEACEAAIADEVLQSAQKAGYQGIECRVVLEREQETEDFGKVKEIHLCLHRTDELSARPIRYLQKRIADDYGLEEEYVQIQVLTGQG